MSNVHEIKRVSFLDVPGRLREIADDIEQKGIPTVVMVMGYANGKVSIRSFGERTSGLMTLGWLARAQATMAEGANADDNDEYMWDPPPSAA